MDISIDGCFFSENTAAVAGGGIHSALQNDGLRIRHSHFLDNYSPYGGGVYFGADHSNVAISLCLFQRNGAIDGGNDCV